MTAKSEKLPEKALYEPVKEFLYQKFVPKFGNCHLEITARGHLQEIRHFSIKLVKSIGNVINNARYYLGRTHFAFN